MSSRRTVQRVCENADCGVTFPAMVKEVNRGWGRFCSQSCASIPKGHRTFARHPQSGAGNFNFKDWASTRPSVYVNRYRAKNPEKVAAQKLMTAAIARGELVRPTACQCCGGPSKRRLDGHHPDYDKPLDVVFVCRRCHAMLDELRRLGIAWKGNDVLTNVDPVPVRTVLLPVYEIREAAFVDGRHEAAHGDQRHHEGFAAEQSIHDSVR